MSGHDWNRRHRVLLLVLLLATGCLAKGERSSVVFPPGGMTIDSTGSQPRHFAKDSLRLVLTVGGDSDQDTTLIDPYLMASDSAGVFLFESDGRILRYDTTGTRLWVKGRSGGGPGEYRNPRDMKFGPDRGLWLVDPDQGRVTVLDPGNGRVRSMIPMKVAYSNTITPLRTGFVLYPSFMPDDIYYFGAKGDTAGADSIQWSGRAIEWMSRQIRSAVDPVSSRWVIGFIYGNGWFAYDTTRQGTTRRFYIEPTRFPPVIKQSFPDGAIGTKLVRSPASALDLELRGDTVFVLFGGAGADERRKIDLYSFETGNYLESFTLPWQAEEIGLCGRYLAVYTSRPVPKLSFFLREKRL